jgi:hypothetical protein
MFHERCRMRGDADGRSPLSVAHRMVIPRLVVTVDSGGYCPENPVVREGRVLCMEMPTLREG